MAAKKPPDPGGTVPPSTPPPAGNNIIPSGTSSGTTTPSRNAANLPWVGCNIKGNNLQLRPYHQIISESNSINANVIVQIKLVKIIKDPNFPDRKPTSLTDAQVGELLFDILGLDHKACLELDMRTGRYDTREMLVPANTDLSKLLTTHTTRLQRA